MTISDLVSSLGGYLPVTVTAAFILFITRELLELRRRKAGRTRKTKAIKILLAEELEKNHWVFVSMLRILEQMKEASDEYPNAVFGLHIARDGSEHFRMKNEPEDEFEQGSWIPKFHSTLYEKLLPSLAELDQALFESISSTYSEIAELSHYRETLTSFLAGEDLAPDPGMTRHFLDRFAGEKDDYYNALNNGYKVLTGTDLKEWRLR